MFDPLEGFQARFTVAANAERKGMAHRKKKSGIRMAWFRISFVE